MPEENYLLEPHPNIRNFGEFFGHVANAQFNACAAAKGEANPNQGLDQELLNNSKAEFLAALAASFAYCDPVYAALTDHSRTWCRLPPSVALVRGRGRPTSPSSSARASSTRGEPVPVPARRQGAARERVGPAVDPRTPDTPASPSASRCS